MLIHRSPSPVRPARVVVLGKRGFVAGSLLQQLSAAGHETLALGSSDIDLTAADAGAALRERLRETDSLVFISALTPDKGRDIATMMKNLAMGTAACDAIAACPPAHVVYLSTDAVYADDANPVREASCASPTSFHGTMHLARERMLSETCRSAKVPLALLRPSLLFGAGDTHNGYGPNRFMRSALGEGRIALFGGGEEQRDHVYIDDVSRLTALVLAHRSEGVLNVATGTARSFRAVAEEVASLAGRPVSIECSPRANPITHRHFDVTAAIAAFPSFRYTTVREGLDASLQTLRAAS